MWNATYRAEGGFPAAVVVVDAAGAVWEANLSAAFLAPVGVAVDFLAAPAGGFEAQVTISGGAPPFVYWINETAGGSWNGTSPVDGTLTVEGSSTESGNTTFDVTVRDAWDRYNSTEATVELRLPGGNGDLAPSVENALGAVILVLAAVGGGAWWRRRRSSRPPAPVPDAEATLHRIIGPADGADRAVVELVAEEEGVPLPIVRETLERLIAQGTVRAERGMDGEEVLAWSREPSP